MSEGQTQVPMDGLLSRSSELNDNINNTSSGKKTRRKRRRSQARRRREESTEEANKSEITHSTGAISSKRSPTPKLETTLTVGSEPRSTILHEQGKGVDEEQDEGVVMQRGSPTSWSPTKKANAGNRVKTVDDTPQDSTHTSSEKSKEAKPVMDPTPTPQRARKSKKSKRNKGKRQQSPVLEGGDKGVSSTCTPPKASIHLPSQKLQSACFDNLPKSLADARQVVNDSVSSNEVASPPEKGRGAACDTPRTTPRGAVPEAECTPAEPGSEAVKKSKRKARKKKKKQCSSAGSTLSDDARQTQNGSTHPESTSSTYRGNASSAGGSSDATNKDSKPRANGHTSPSKVSVVPSESTSRGNLFDSSQASTGATPPVKVAPPAELSSRGDKARHHEAETGDRERQPLDATHSNSAGSMPAAAKDSNRQSNAKPEALANSGSSGSNGPGRGGSTAPKAHGNDTVATGAPTSPVARAKIKNVDRRAAETSKGNPGAGSLPGDKATPELEAIKSKWKKNGTKRHSAPSPDPDPSSSRVKSPPRLGASTPGATQLPRNSDEHRGGKARKDLARSSPNPSGNHGPGGSATNGIAGINGHVGGTGPGIGSPSGALKRTREERKGGANGNPSPGWRMPRKHQEQRRRLPVFTHRDAILNAVKAHQTTVLVGETGSGKSTQIPQFLYEAGVCGTEAGGNQHNLAGSGFNKKRRFSGGSGGDGRDRPDEEEGAAKNRPRGVHKAGGVIVACTQPRRVAAVTVARRVAEEAGSELGHAVGYSVRFDDCTSRSTRIKYMTDGVLLREAMSDPLLSAYGAVVLDEIPRPEMC